MSQTCVQPATRSMTIPKQTTPLALCCLRSVIKVSVSKAICSQKIYTRLKKKKLKKKKKKTTKKHLPKNREARPTALQPISVIAGRVIARLDCIILKFKTYHTHWCILNGSGSKVIVASVENVLFVFKSGVSANAVPHYQKLRTRVTHIWGNRKGQPNRSAMERPRPERTSLVIKVPPVPGKYAW